MTTTTLNISIDAKPAEAGAQRAKKAFNEVRAAALGGVQSVEKFGSQSSKAFKEAALGADNTADSFQNLKKNIIGITGAFLGLSAASSVLSSAFSAFSDMEKQAAAMALQLGITNEKAQQFADIANSIYTAGIGDSLEKTTQAVAKVAQQFNDLGVTSSQEIEGIASKSLAFANTFNDKYEKTIQAAQNVMRNFGLTSEEAFDFIAAGYQRGMDQSGDFLDSINEYSTQFSNGGASAAQFFSVMETGLQGGVLGTDKAADAFKEFQLRILDGSKLTHESLDLLGIDSDKFTQKVENGSMTVADAFTIVVDKMKRTNNAGLQMQSSVGLVGTKFEDMGMAAGLNIDLAATSMKDLAGAAANVAAQQETIGVKATAAWRTFLHTIATSEGFEKFASQSAAALGWLTQNMNELIATAGLAIKIIGTSGAFILGLKTIGLVSGAAATAQTALGMAALRFSAAAGAGAGASKILTTNLWGTSVAAQAASGSLAKLKIAGQSAFAAFVGWEIGSYIYDQFNSVKYVATDVLETVLVGFENLKANSQIVWLLMSGYANEAWATIENVALGSVGRLIVGWENFKASSKIAWLSLAEYAQNSWGMIESVVLGSMGRLMVGWENIKFGAEYAWLSIIKSTTEALTSIHVQFIIGSAKISKTWAGVSAAFQAVAGFIGRTWNELLSNLTGKISNWVGSLAKTLESMDFLPGVGDAVIKLSTLSSTLKITERGFQKAADSSKSFSDIYQEQSRRIDENMGTQLRSIGVMDNYGKQLIDLEKSHKSNVIAIKKNVTALQAANNAGNTYKNQIAEIKQKNKLNTQSIQDNVAALQNANVASGDHAARIKSIDNARQSNIETIKINTDELKNYYVNEQYTIESTKKDIKVTEDLAQSHKLVMPSIEKTGQAAQNTSIANQALAQSHDKAAKAAKMQVDQLENLIGQLELEAKTAGMSAQQKQLINAEMKGANTEQLKYIQNLQIEALQKTTLADLDSKLGQIGKTPEQIQLESLARQGLSDKLLAEVQARQQLIATNQGDIQFEKTTEGLRAELELLGLTNTERERTQFITQKTGDFATKNQKKQVGALYDQIEAQKDLNSQQAEMQKMWDEVGGNAVDAFSDIITGTKSAKGAFGDFTDSLQNMWKKMLLDMAKQKMMSAMTSGGMGSMMGGGGASAGTAPGGGMSFGKMGGGMAGAGKTMGVGAAGAAAGGLIGGSSGAMNVGSFATMGAMVGGPWGAAIGAAVGVVLTVVQNKFEKTAEGMTASFKGLDAQFGMWERWEKGGLFGGADKVDYRYTDVAAKKTEKFNEALKKTAETIGEVADSLGVSGGGLIGSLDDFQFYIEAKEDKGYAGYEPGEWFAEKMEIARVAAIKYAIRKIHTMEPDTSASEMIGSDIAMYMFQIVDGTFSKALRDSHWSGAMSADSIKGNKKAQAAITEGLQDFMDLNEDMFKDMNFIDIQETMRFKIYDLFSEVSNVAIPHEVALDLANRMTVGLTDSFQAIEMGGVVDVMDRVGSGIATFLGENVNTYSSDVTKAMDVGKKLNEFIALNIETLEGMPIDDLKNILSTKSEELFKEIGDLEVGLPDGISLDLAESLAKDIKTAFSDIKMGPADLGIDENVEFFKTFQKMTDEFSGGEKELTAFVDSMFKIRDAFGDLGLETKGVTENLIIAAGGAVEFAKQFSFFGDKFLPEFVKNGIFFQNASEDVADGFKELGVAVPKTRQEFSELALSLDTTIESEQQLFNGLMDLAPAMDTFFGALEKVFTIDASWLGQNLMDSIFQASNSQEAGQMMGDRFAEAFYTQMIGSVINTVAQSMMDGMVAPFLNSSAQAALNITQGSNVAALTDIQSSNAGAITEIQSSIVAGQTIEDSGQKLAKTFGWVTEEVIKQAETKILGMVDLMKGLQESGVMDKMTEAMSGMGSFAFEAVQASPVAQFTAAAPQRMDKIDDTTKSVDKLSESAENALPNFDDLRLQLEILGKGLTGNEIALFELNEKYKNTSASQLLAAKSADEFIDKAIELTDAQLQELANQAEITGDKLESDILSAIKILQDEEAKLAEARQKQSEFNINLAQQLNDLTGQELDLFSLEKEFQQIRIEAESVGADLNLVEQLYGKKRADIVEEYAKEAAEAIAGFRQPLVEFGLQLSESERFIFALDEEFSHFGLAANALTIDTKETANALSEIPQEQLIAFADKYGLSIDEISQKTMGYLENSQQLQDVLGGFVGNMSQLATGTDDASASLASFSGKYPELSEAANDASLTAKDAAKAIISLGTEGIAKFAIEAGAGIEEFTSDLEGAVGAVGSLRDAERERTEAAIDAERERTDAINNLKTSLTDMGASLGEGERFILDLDSEFAHFGLAANALTIDTKETANALSEIPYAQVMEFADKYGLSIEQVSEKTTGYLQAAQQLQDVLGGFVGKMNQLATGATDAETTLASFSDRYPQFAEAANDAGLTAKAAAQYFVDLGEEGIAKMAIEAGKGIEEFTNDMEGAIGAVGSLRESEAHLAKERLDAQNAIEKTASGFRTEMAKMNSGLSDSEWAVKKLRGQYPILNKLLDEQGMAAGDFVKTFENWQTDDMSYFAKQAGVTIEELVNNAGGLVSALESIEDEKVKIEKERIDEIKRLGKERDDTLMKSIDDLFATFDKLSQGIRGVRDSILKNIQSFETPEQKNAQRESRMVELSTQVTTDLDIRNGDAAQLAIDNINEYQQLIMDDTKYRIKQINKEKDTAKKAYDERIKLDEDMSNTIQSSMKSISTDVAKFNDELNRTTTEASEAKIVLSEQFQDLIDAGDYENAVDATTRLHDKIKLALDEEITGIETRRDENIEALKQQNEVTKDLRDSLQAVQKAVGDVRKSIASDIAGLEKEIGISGPSRSVALGTMQISDDMPVTPENIAIVDEYRSLVLDSMNEQINLEKERFEKVQETYQTQIEQQKSLEDFAKNLKGFVDDIALSADVSTFTNQEMLGEAQRQYQEILAGASAGDTEAQGKLTGAAQEYLKQARDFYASSQDYTDIFGNVNTEIKGLASTAEVDAAAIAAEMPLDATATGQNVADISSIQNEALNELKRLDEIMANMDSSLAMQLEDPKATPLPAEQLQTLIDAENALAEKQILAAKETTQFELIGLNEKLLAIKEYFDLEAEKSPFDESPFALEIAEIERESIEKLTGLNDTLVLMDESLKMSLSENVNNLAMGLSFDLQTQVGERLQALIGIMPTEFASSTAQIVGAVSGISGAIGEMQSTLSNQISKMKTKPQVLPSQTIDKKPETVFASTKEIARNKALSTAFEGGERSFNREAGAKLREWQSFDVGTENVPSDMTAQIHKGEMILDPRSASVLRDYGIKFEQPITGGDNSKILVLLNQILALLSNGQNLTQQGNAILVQSVNNLEKTVGMPIKRAIEKEKRVRV